jgi:hypothetical protein
MLSAVSLNAQNAFILETFTINTSLPYCMFSNVSKVPLLKRTNIRTNVYTTDKETRKVSTRQAMYYNVTMRLFRVSIVAVEK